jgi:hypothetical protein
VRTGAGTIAPVVLAPADYVAALARTLDRAATGATETAAAAAPFAVNSFFTGPGSFTAQSATQIRQDRAGGATLAEKFAPGADPTLALPLAGGRGYWLVGVLTQTGSYSSNAGIRKATWPDGAIMGIVRLCVASGALMVGKGRAFGAVVRGTAAARCGPAAARSAGLRPVRRCPRGVLASR